jgi:methylglutaconyl-CoA hydratase
VTPSADAPLRIVRDGPVATIHLARPDKRNALDLALAQALGDAIVALGDDAAVRVLAIRGDGPDFCAGADLAALERLVGADAETHRVDAETLGRVFVALRESRLPTVAVVTGRALAGGAGLASACDLVVAHEAAEFGYPEVRIGFVPAMVMTMLRRIVGERAAADLVLTGRRIGAAEAQALGLVSRVFAADGFEEAVAKLLGGLAKSPPSAMAATKRLLYALDGPDFRAGIAAGVAANVEARQTPAFADGVRRFVGKRDAPAPGGSGPGA